MHARYRRLIRDAIPRDLRPWLPHPVESGKEAVGLNVSKSTRVARRRAQQRALDANLPLRHQVLYESYYGEGALDSPLAIFEELLEDPRYPSLKHVWVLRGPGTAWEFVTRYRDHPRVKFVQIGTRPYRRELARSRWLVNNSTFPPYFVKRAGQVYVNTWHGTPLKHMGYDMPNGRVEAGNTLRNFLSADYLVSANPHMTDVMYGQAYRLAGLFEGTIIETGYPRIDATVRGTSAHELIKRELRDYNVEIPDGRRVVLYAPTWKGDSYHEPHNDAEDIADTVLELQSQLGDDYFVIAKPHQKVAKFSRGLSELDGRVVPARFPVNRVLAVTDCLISDYSSVFFDFLPLQRPIYFFSPDAAIYDESRGRYVPDEDLPGPSFATVADLARAIASEDFEEPRLAAARDAFAPWDDGNATARIIDVVFGDHRDLPVGRLVTFDAERQKLLFYIGGLRRNGITSSVLNLLRHLDYDRFDVSVNFETPRGAEAREILSEIDDRARLIETPWGVAEQFLRVAFRRRRQRTLPMASKLSALHIDRAFGREWRRIFGTANFDYAIDFSGYSPKPAAVILVAPGARHSIWLHNEIDADMQRTVDGEMPHYSNLSQVRELYPLFDDLVSVSEALSRINAASLADVTRPDQFRHARNFIDGDRVLTLSNAPDAWENEFHDPSLSSRVRRARDEVANIEPGPPVFVCVGRLSPEKNHRRLIEAFRIVLSQSPDARLIIVGDGPTRGALVSEVVASGMGGSIHFVGATANPFVYMAAATCLVMSSDYEGQPMVILEARVLGLPVVSTRFGSVVAALPADAGLIVDQSSDALAEGMLAHVRGEVPARTLDYVAYNAKCLSEFYEAIGVTE